MKRFICLIFGHRWRMLHRLSFVGIAQCARCRHYVVMDLPLNRADCRPIVVPEVPNHAKD